MKQTIEISSDTAAIVESQAKLVGLSVDDYIKSLMPNEIGHKIAKTPHRSVRSKSRVKAFQAWIDGQRSEAPPIPLESLRRENLY